MSMGLHLPAWQMFRLGQSEDTRHCLALNLHEFGCKVMASHIFWHLQSNENFLNFKVQFLE